MPMAAVSSDRPQVSSPKHLTQLSTNFVDNSVNKVVKVYERKYHVVSTSTQILV